MYYILYDSVEKVLQCYTFFTLSESTENKKYERIRGVNADLNLLGKLQQLIYVIQFWGKLHSPITHKFQFADIYQKS